MNISIRTQADNGHLILYLINSNGIKILTLRGNENGNCTLVTGHTYRLEWHVWSPTSAYYSINALVETPELGSPPFEWEKSYESPHQDMGGFYFTV
ncbi:MAG TPA: hypothetical protein PLU49_09090 [Saprospiraceae bacterium]|nr:hypothetical protein [Saprospiraceae bacterium]